MEETIILYSTNCSRCKVLEKKLDEKNITYTVNSDTDVMISKGFMSAPILEVNGEIMDFGKAVEWLRGVK